MCAGQGRGHGGAVVTGAGGQEAVEEAQADGAAAGLAVGAWVGGEVQGGEVAGVLGWTVERGDGQAGLGHERVAAGGPAVARGQAAEDALPFGFQPADAVGARPGGDATVAGIGPEVAGFLMADEVGGAVFRRASSARMVTASPVRRIRRRP